MTETRDWRALATLRRRREPGAAAQPARAPGDAETQPSRLWTYLNSPLVLLIMSSVVLTGISQHFAHSQAEAHERAERRASFFKLFTELEYRITRLQIDEDLLTGLSPDDAAGMRRLGQHARDVITGTAPDGQSAAEYQKMYLGAIVNQEELSAGLPANRELEPVLDELVIDDCETAIALHGELNVLRRWVAQRAPLVDDGKLPKLPAQVLPQADQTSLVMPDFDALRSEDAGRWLPATAKLERMRGECEDAEPPAD